MHQNQLKEIIQSTIPFVERAGLRVIHLEPGKSTCEMPIAGNENHFASMYAGALFTLADITGGALLLASFDTSTYYPTLKNLELDFFKPATTDIHLSLTVGQTTIEKMKSIAEESGKAECQLEGDLVDRKGMVVAQMRGSFVIVQKAD